MDKTYFEGKWNQLTGSLKETWGDLTDDDVAKAEGNAEKLVGVIQEKFGLAREEVEAKFDELKDKL